MQRTAQSLVLLAAASVAVPVAGQEQRPLGQPVGGTVPCAAALLADETANWLTDAPLVADFTLDGRDDVVVWGVASGQLVVRVARCAGEAVVDDWRYPFPVEEGCEVAAASVEAESLLIPQDAVARVCARGEQRDECIQLRRENDRRRALMDAGGRRIVVQKPACLAMSLAWDERRGGFVVMPR